MNIISDRSYARTKKTTFKQVKVGEKFYACDSACVVLRIAPVIVDGKKCNAIVVESDTTFFPVGMMLKPIKDSIGYKVQSVSYFI